MLQASIPAGSGVGGNGNSYGMGFLYGDSLKENVSQGINLEHVVNDSLSFQLDYHGQLLTWLEMVIMLSNTQMVLGGD